MFCVTWQGYFSKFTNALKVSKRTKIEKKMMHLKKGLASLHELSDFDDIVFKKS